MRVTILSWAVDTSFDPHSSPGALFPVEPVFTDTRLHVGARNQLARSHRSDGLPAVKIMFVGSHALHFLRHDQRASCFDRVRDEADICEDWLS